jgi:hypothetical protein
MTPLNISPLGAFKLKAEKIEDFDEPPIVENEEGELPDMNAFKMIPTRFGSFQDDETDV